MILISSHSDSSYFLQEEILRAIDLAQDERHRVLPVYLTGNRAQNRDVPLPLKQLQSVFLVEEFSLLRVAQKIEATLQTAKRREEWRHEINPATVVIVTGCDHMPELYDRPSAYELKEAIDSEGRLHKKSYLGSVVMGDIWFWEHSGITDWPNIISVGGAVVNSLTAHFVRQCVTVEAGGTEAEGRWEIMRDAKRWALFGGRAQDTQAAVQWFKSHYLVDYLREVWSSSG